MIMIMGSSSRIGSSFSSCLVAPLPSPFHRTTLFQSRLSQGLFVNKQTAAQLQIYAKGNPLAQSVKFTSLICTCISANDVIYGFPDIYEILWKCSQEGSRNSHNALSVVSEDQPQSTELDEAALVPESEDAIAEDISTIGNSSFNLLGSDGKPGFISFFNRPYRKDNETLSSKEESQNSILWFVGPAVLVASFIFPSLYLRKVLSIIFEDSLLTVHIKFPHIILHRSNFLLWCCGISLSTRPIKETHATRNRNSCWDITSLLLLPWCLVSQFLWSLWVWSWPWTGPAASATLAPYLVGIVVQFAFEQYARYRKSTSWSAIPLIIQVYRLHQLNRAAQLVTALSFTVRGAEMTSHNMAINNSLGTLLNVLQFLGVICIWSLSSFLMRFIPPASTAAQ
ncbi:hypothetical protein AHAS_Ahas20G0011800 [Arachis hypogaea]